MTNSNGESVMVQGRVVWAAGDLFQGKIKTDMNTNQPVIDSEGQPVKEYGFGLAVPKSELSDPAGIWTVMHREAMSLYPGGQLPPDFAMKYKDGDGIDHNGKSFAEREGYKGCIVLSCTTRIPIKWFKYENNQNFQISEGIKCGDWVNVQLSVKAHGAFGRGKPGLYLNPNAVQLIGYGEEIINTPSGDQIFGVQAPPVPQGASASPVASNNMIVPPSTLAPTGQPPAPHHGVLPAAHQPAQAPVTPQTVPQMAPVTPPVNMAPQAPAGLPSVPGLPTY